MKSKSWCSWVSQAEQCSGGEGTSSNSLASDGQPASLIIGQAESSATELLLEDSVLLAEIFNDRILLAADPASP
jgi:hypothetical protein